MKGMDRDSPTDRTRRARPSRLSLGPRLGRRRAAERGRDPGRRPGLGATSASTATPTSGPPGSTRSPVTGPVRPVLRLPGLLADPGRVSHGPVPPALRGPRGLHRRRTPRPRRVDGRRRLQGRRLRDRGVRQWHNGSQYPYHPTGRGFDEYYGFASGHWGDYFTPPAGHNGKSSPVTAT